MGNDSRFLSNKKYEPMIVWIDNAREKHKSWNEIDYACKSNEKEFEDFLQRQSEESFWDITPQEFRSLVHTIKDIKDNQRPGFIGDPNKPEITEPRDEGSCWVQYIKHLEKQGFSFESIENIKVSTKKIMKQLCDYTPFNDPVRGIVFGNVQSGKTANISALISIAADFGYNFFLVLTGTIDNLRIQNRDRLRKDLVLDNTNLKFNVLENLDGSHNCSNKLQNLYLDENNNSRYLYVCLKNSSVLRKLNQWFNSDVEKKKKLKILLIDDEADQAGINGANISANLRATINRLIINIVFAKDENDIQRENYCCMNYIGYTATPYANFLNEANNDSLYPKNFICSLQTSRQYIGPSQIFGIDNVNAGLPIKNIICDQEVEDIRNAQLSYNGNLPEGLKSAIYWFVCTVVIFRKWKLNKCVSMLIHSSQKVSLHTNMQIMIERFLKNIEPEKVIDDIEKVYIEQCNKLSKDVFIDEMNGYCENPNVKDYPKFYEIKDEIIELLQKGPTHIALNEKNALTYSESLQVCVDNCQYNPNSEEYMLRIVYPNDNDKAILAMCPAFIVIGGATLSRGLTLKGLTTSYFLRTTKTADTLMQMGRWFGYSIDYELLDRIWLSNKTIKQYTFLSKLDYDLREELLYMQQMQLTPLQYGPRLDNFPEFSYLKITANRKMQSAQTVSTSYINKKGQTTKFFSDPSIIKDNFDKTINFINSLGKIDKNEIKRIHGDWEEKLINNTFVWFNQDFCKVFDFISSLTYPPSVATFENVDEIKKWYAKQYNSKTLNNFNIVVSSLNENENNTKLSLENITVNLPTRTKLYDFDPAHINLKVLTDSNDFLLDVDTTKFTEYDKENMNINSKFIIQRYEYGMQSTPLLIIYIINKDSKPDKPVDCDHLTENQRIPLNTPQHLVGYFLYIPYGNNSNNNSKIDKVSVKLDFPEGGDIDDEISED